DPETAVSYIQEMESEYGEDFYEEGDDIAFYSDVTFFFVQNIIDLDHDGIYEFIMSWQAYEAEETYVYQYDGSTFTMVLCYGWGV
ncbi:MAG: hypothetical protein AAGU77_11630, partial [Bacillota bacterium]